MNPRLKVTIPDKPSQIQLKDWYENGTVVSFTDADGTIYHGKIKKYYPYEYDDYGLLALLVIENSSFGVYLGNITTYTLDSIFIDANSNSPEKVGLIAGDKIFWINKEVISERLEYFKKMFQNGMKESGEQVVDLSQLFSSQELDVLLLVFNVCHCKNLTLEQAKIFIEAANKICQFKMIEQAQVRIDECIAIINKEFFLAIFEKNYTKCTEMLLRGANNINKEMFDDSLSPSPLIPRIHYTPLIHAVMIEDEKLLTSSPA